MRRRLTIAGFEGQTIEVRTAIFGEPTLLIDGRPAQRGARRGELLLRRSDGAAVSARWRPVARGWDTPQLEVGGVRVEVVAPLRWHEWLWAALPLALVVAAGLVGALGAALAMSISVALLRWDAAPVALRYLLSAAATAAIAAAALLLSGLLGEALLAAIGGA